MILAQYSYVEIKDKAFCCFLQHTLPSSFLKGLKAHIAGVVPPQPDCTQRYQKQAIKRTPSLIERTPPDFDPVANHLERAPATGIASSSPMPYQLFPNEEINQGVAALKNKRKEYNMAHYRNRKLRALATTMTTTTTTMMTTMTTTTTMTTKTTTLTTTPAAAMSSSADPWSVTIHGTLRKPAVARKVKCKIVKPDVKAICQGGNIASEAVVLRAVADHPALNAARKLAGIEMSKTLAA
jgi:hypothetical protein